jgi:hypothetical protein
MGHDPTVSLRTYAHSHDDAQDAAAAAMTLLLSGTRPALRVVENPEPPARDHTVTTATPADDLANS